MKIKINKTGSLEIERAGRGKKQYCPFVGEDRINNCGDWCPLFGEPEPHATQPVMMLKLCHTYICGEITDERGK